jgi:hypothetical protein
LFKDPDGEGIAFATAQMMQEFGLDPTAGAQTGRRAPRGARRVTGKGEYTAENLNSEDVARLRVTSRGSEESQISQWDSLASQVKGNIKKLKEFAGSNKASDAQRKRIVEVVSRYEEAQKRIAKSNKAAKKALAKITGTKGARTNEAALKNIATLGDSYGVSGPLGKALNGGRYDVESFFAELVGGSKFDIRQGTRFSKLQQGKLVRVAPAREEFVNIFENEVGKLVDLDGKLVNTAGELVDDAGRRVDRQGRIINSQGQLVDGEGAPIINPKTGFPFQGDGASGGYVFGKKSPIPNQLIQKQDALISRIRQKAQVRRNKLAGVSDDADFIPMDEIRTGSVNSKGDVSWVFADNLYGPRGYANQLELQLGILDDKIKQADELAKKVKKTEKQAERVVLPRPSAVEASRTTQRSRRALVAAQKLNELESSFFYPRAVERQKFHDFLLRFAAMSEDDIENLDFGISAVDEGAVRSGMNLTREEALRVYRIDQQMVESNINRLEAELERLRRQRAQAGQRLNEVSGHRRTVAPLERAVTKAETDAEIARRRLDRAKQQPSAAGRILDAAGVKTAKTGALPRAALGAGAGYLGVMSYQEALERFKAGDTSEGVLKALQAGAAGMALLPPAGKGLTRTRGAGVAGTLGLGAVDLGPGGC